MAALGRVHANGRIHVHCGSAAGRPNQAIGLFVGGGWASVARQKRQPPLTYSLQGGLFVGGFENVGGNYGTGTFTRLAEPTPSSVAGTIVTPNLPEVIDDSTHGLLLGYSAGMALQPATQCA